MKKQKAKASNTKAWCYRATMRVFLQNCRFTAENESFMIRIQILPVIFHSFLELFLYSLYIGIAWKLISS